MRFRYDIDTEELVVSESTRTEYHQLNIWLTRHVKNYKYIPAFKMGVWNGKQTYFNNGRINLGLWKECLKGCQEIGSPFIIDNKDDFPINRSITLESVREFCRDFFKNHKIKDDQGKWVDFHPYDHQIETAFKILKNRYCLAEVATSGGKTLIISIVYFFTIRNIDPSAKILIIVPSITLVTQFYDAIVDSNIGLNKDYDGGNPSPIDLKIEEIMSDRPRKHGSKEDPNIYIGTYQSLEKFPEEFFKKFHTISVDESHGAKSKTLISILKKSFNSAYSRFGLSGTFPPDDSCEILTIQSVIGPKITEVSANELRKKGIITPMDIKVVIMNHNDLDFSERVIQIRKGGYGKEALEIEKDYIHQSTKRSNLIKKIVSKCDSNTLLLFHTIEYGQQIFNLLSKEITDKDFYYIDGGIPNKKREDIKKEMERTEGRTKVLIASYGTLSTGVSINAIFNIVFVDSFKSEQIIIQSIGRALRLHSDKSVANIFDLVDVFSNDMSNILYKHFTEREKFYIKRQYPYKSIKINL